MRSDLTDVTVVLDRSGSMSSIRTDAEGGLNEFIKQQKAMPGEGRFTLVQFDDRHEVVHQSIRLQDVPHCELLPRGNTALLDAVGKTIVATGERLAALPEDQRPGLVAFVILTDGMENASHEYSSEQVREMIERQTKDYNWQFTYLGANQDAFAQAGAMGIMQSATADFAASNSPQAFKSAHKNLQRMRTASAQGHSVENRYTDGERKEMVETQQ